MGRPGLDISNLVGQKFNKLTITEHIGIVNHIRMVTAICDCGVEKEYRLFNIIGNGKTKSCGCYNTELVTKRNKDNSTHGLTGHPLLSVWHGMRSRCYDLTDESYRTYGGEGVIICKEWLDDFRNFYNWAIENGWEAGLQIDKDKLAPDKKGKIYSPEFCCFLTPKENSLYRRTSTVIEYNNEFKSLREWANVLNIDYRLLSNRRRCNWNVKRMFETPKRQIKKQASKT